MFPRAGSAWPLMTVVAWTRQGGFSHAKVTVLFWAVLVAWRYCFVATVLTYHHVIEVDAFTVAPSQGKGVVMTRSLDIFWKAHSFTVSTQSLITPGIVPDRIQLTCDYTVCRNEANQQHFTFCFIVIMSKELWLCFHPNPKQMPVFWNLSWEKLKPWSWMHLFQWQREL